MKEQNGSGTNELTAEELRAWLTCRLADLQRVDPQSIDIRERFSRYGLDSMGAGRMLADLSQRVGRSLPATLVWEYPTIDALAQRLSGGASEPLVAKAVSKGAQVSPPSEKEPIAIVGLACRFPKAPSAEDFWRLLRDGVDAITEVPKDRWNIDALYDVDPSAPGKMSTRWGGFLEQVDRFDAPFFGISPREAALMDPQQRLMLELSWEALEDAGVPPDGLKDSQTGVFFGAMWTDYAKVASDRADVIAQHTATGQDNSIIPARVSYALGLQGPSVAVNTACSSALVAVHLACQSLRSGESSLALAGGVNLILSPESTIAMSKFGAMAPDGRSKAFDARANGYVRGEGGGVVVLKPLSRALADGDPIYCVIRGSAVNNDGFSNGLTAPSPQAQEAMLRAAYAHAGVAPERVHYVEAHGTGTMLGDPIEANALGKVLGTARPAERPLRLGSVKTNIGHLEAAAGIAGLIKTALAIKHREIPPSLHFEQPNPHIDFSELRLQVQQRGGAWPADGEPALAGVSSFGFGGTNCHVVLEGARSRAAHLLPLSADSQAALRTLAQAVRELATAPGARPSVPELCATTAARLSHHDHRLALTIRSDDELRAHLDGFLEGQARQGLVSGRAADRKAKVVFAFGGQGSQWIGMGRDLIREEPVFRAALERCEAAIRPFVGWSLLEELTSSGARSIEASDVVQPIIFSIQVALAALWRSWGIEPDAVIGQSMGEVAAAFVAGALRLEDAARIICQRSQLVKRVSGRGGMALVELSLEEARHALRGYEDRLSIAVSSGPTSTVLSGDAAALEEVLTALQGRGIFGRPIKVDYASHSPQMDPLLPELLQALEGIQPRAGTVPLYSTVTGDLLDGGALDAAYWARNLREPVLFSGAAARLFEAGHEVFIDVNPHPLLAHALEQILTHAGQQGTVLPSLRRDEEGRAVLLDSLGALYVLGRAVHWHRLSPIGSEAAPLPSLPGLESPPADSTEASPSSPPELLTLSARGPEALQSSARALSTWLSELHDAEAADLCYTASARRSHHAHRLAIVARSRQEIRASIEAFVRSDPREGLFSGEVKPGTRLKVVFVYPGQGSQWVGMGRALLDKEPVFRRAIEACDEAIRREAGFSVLEELGADEGRSRLGEIDVVQPVLFALEVALSELWRSWGVEPDAVVGHSMGEVAAAHVAGALSLPDAAAIICRRSRLLRSVSGKGAMALCELTMEQTEEVLRGYASRLSVAASNGPQATVIAGDPAALREVLATLDRRGVFCRRVKVDVASHSPQMDPLREELLAALHDIAPRRATLPMRSTVTAELVRGDELAATYWADNLRKPVLFAPVTRGLIEQGHTLFVEMSPHPVLLPSIEESLQACGREGATCASLRRHVDERSSLLESLGGLYVRGVSVDFGRLYPESGRVVALPPYPWQRKRHWMAEERRPRRIAESGGHPLLGKRLRSALAAVQFEAELRPDAPSFLADHVIYGSVVVPGASHVAMILASAAALRAEACALEQLTITQAMVLGADEARTVQLILNPEEGQGFDVRVLSTDAAETNETPTWTAHATGKLRLGARGAPGVSDAEAVLDAARARCLERSTGAQFYEGLRACGYEYGPSLQWIKDIQRRDGEALARLEVAEGVSDVDRYPLHPTLVDACFQMTCAAFPGGVPFIRSTGDIYVPFSVQRLALHALHERHGGPLWCHARLRDQDAESKDIFALDLRLFDESGRTVAEIEGLHMKRARRDLLLGGANERLRDWFYELQWELEARPGKSAARRALTADGAGRWLIFADRGGFGRALAAALEKGGEPCVLVSPGASSAAGELGIDPERPEAFRQLLSDHFGKGKPPCRGVIHLWTLDATSLAETTPASLDAAQAPGVGSVVYLVQALTQAGLRDLPRLWLLTRGTQAAGSELAPLAIAGAPLWGLGRVIAHEHPDLRCARLDLAPSGAPDEIASVLDEIRADGDEDQVALRREGRYVARLARCRVKEEQPTLRADGTYLITGGLGGLGLSFARWMVERGARNLVLVGRRSPSEAAHEAIASLERAGAKVMVASADVAREDQMAEVIASARQSMPPLRGVLHAAGLLDDGVIQQQSLARFREVMRPKVQGSVVLHTLTAGAPLDFFALFSSAASLLGLPGQSNYAAANAFLDALAHHRRALGLPAQSINWGPWSEVGLAAAQANRGERLADRGLSSISPDKGVEAFGRLLHHPSAQVGVMALDLRQWREFYIAVGSSPLFKKLAEEQSASAVSKGAKGYLLEALRAAEPGARRALLEGHLREQIALVVRCSPAEIQPSMPLGSLGLDSLMGIEIRNRLEASLGLALSTTLVWSYPSVHALAVYLTEKVEAALSPAESPAAATASAPTAAESAARAETLEELSELPEDEMAALLAEELAAARQQRRSF